LLAAVPRWWWRPDQVANSPAVAAAVLTRVVVGAPSAMSLAAVRQASSFRRRSLPDGPTHAARSDAALNFTSGTTQTENWCGLQPAQLSGSAGFSTHVLGSGCSPAISLATFPRRAGPARLELFFAPCNPVPRGFVVNSRAFDAKGLLATIGRCGVTTLCAPPTVLRRFIRRIALSSSPHPFFLPLHLLFFLHFLPLPRYLVASGA